MLLLLCSGSLLFNAMQSMFIVIVDLLCFATCASALSISEHGVAHVFENGTAEMDQAFAAAFEQYEKTFDYKLYDKFVAELEQGVERYKTSRAYKSYAYLPTMPHCDKGEASPLAVKAMTTTSMAAFPGGSVKKLFGFDFSKSMFSLATTAEGPAAAGLITPLALGKTALGMGAGLVQAVVSSAVSIVPPLIPPPVWNNQPLPCVPMITGHNCFGSVLYPITMADFVIADVTDSMLDGYISGFPNTYASKVGKTDDTMYKACFASVMSMMCSSLFPRCSVPQANDMPGGRLPMCLHLCILPLITCPGFWIGDLQGSCSMVSVPPMCTQAFYWDLFKLPPQYASLDEAEPFPAECPPTDTTDASEDASLFDREDIPVSPILAEAEAAMKA